MTPNERAEHRRKAHEGSACPACDATRGIEDNGARGRHKAFLCTACGHQWDAVDYGTERIACRICGDNVPSDTWDDHVREHGRPRTRKGEDARGGVP